MWGGGQGSDFSLGHPCGDIKQAFRRPPTRRTQHPTVTGHSSGLSCPSLRSFFRLLLGLEGRIQSSPFLLSSSATPRVFEQSHPVGLSEHCLGRERDSGACRVMGAITVGAARGWHLKVGDYL